jgi:hypothetical protein
MLAAEVDDFDRIPNDVVLADRLEPKRLHAQRPLADLTVPEKEAGRERLAFDLGPPGRVDQEAEHVLLTGVQASAASRCLLGRLEIDGELLQECDQIGVKQARIARAVQRPQTVTLREELDRLVAARQRLDKDPLCSLRREPIDGLLADPREPS